MSEQTEKMVKVLSEKGIIDGVSQPPSDVVPDDEKPMILLPGPHRLLSTFAEELGDFLKDKGFFYTNGEVKWADLEEKKLTPVGPEKFRTLVENYVYCHIEKFREGGETLNIVKTMKVDEARGVLESSHFHRRLPKVDRVNEVRLVTIRGDSLDNPAARLELLPYGYDAQTKTYTFDTGVSIDETVAFEDALDFLISELSEFPWGDLKQLENKVVSRNVAVQVTAMLSLFCRGLLPRGASRLMFIFKANSQASGKTLLGKLAVAAVCGEPSVSEGKRNEDLSKILDVAAIEGSPYVFFDNIRGHLESEALEAFVTSPSRQGRILGKSTGFKAQVNTIVFITGNGLTYNTDLARRSLVVDLFVPEADAQERKISKILNESTLYSAQYRGRLLSCLWSIVRQWDQAGRPGPSRARKGYEEFSRAICGIAPFAGFGDPMEALPDSAGGDTELADISALMERLASCDKAKGEGASEADFAFNELLDLCHEASLFSWIIGDDKVEDIDRKARIRIGRIFQKFAGKVFNVSNNRKLTFGSRTLKGYKLFNITIQ